MSLDVEDVFFVMDVYYNIVNFFIGFVELVVNNGK